MIIVFKKNFLIVIIFFTTITFSCRKNNSITYVPNPANFSEVYEDFWIKMNTNYVYWDIDSTNWDLLYVQYKPLFAQLNLQNSNDVKKSVGYFKEMTKDLIDNHYYISFQNVSVIDSIINPALTRKQKTTSFHYPYSYFKIDTSYLDKNYLLGFDNSNSFNGVPLITLSGTINQNILFFSCNHFALFKSYQSNITNGVKPVLQYFFNKLNNLPISIKGVIIDVRSNQGGDLSDFNFLLGRFIDKPLYFGYTQSKSGNGRLDYTPWIEAYVNPQPNAKQITIPIIVLADNVSASLSEAVVMAIHSLPAGKFIGEATWGATGPITSEEVFNAGQFTIPNFMSVQTSSCKFKYTDGKIFESKGFSPDITIPFNMNELSNGKDSQLEKAISLLQ
jgi:hypothetical protein